MPDVDSFYLGEENEALHEQLAKCVDRIMELESEVAQYKQRLKERKLWQTQTTNIS